MIVVPKSTGTLWVKTLQNLRSLTPYAEGREQRPKTVKGFEESLRDAINTIDTVADQAEDIAGRVQEYFLGKFAAAEGKLEGDFYTPKCVINLIAEMIEHYNGKIYAPCCSSGGMFV